MMVCLRDLVIDADRDVVSDSAVGSIPVIISTPTFRLFVCFGQAQGSVGVQAFRPKIRIERLDEAVLSGLRRLLEYERDVIVRDQGPRT